MVDSIGSNYTSPTSGPTGKSVLGKEDFMKLLIAQLKNQDPLNPMEGTEFAAQLAQFSSIEQLQNINDTLNASVEANYQLTQSINNTMTASIIGKDAKIGTNTLEYNGQETADFGYSLPANAKQLSITILNEQGAVIKTIENPPMSTGDHKLSWDYTDNNGVKVPNGKYTVKIEGKDFSANELTIEQYVIGAVDGVKFTTDGTKVMINGIEYFLSDILEILNNTGNGN